MQVMYNCFINAVKPRVSALGSLAASVLPTHRFLLVTIILIATLGLTRPVIAQVDLDNPGPWLESIRTTHDLPGLGAAVVTDHGLELLVTTGVRKKGDPTPFTDKDLWHLGSCGKAITATMIARLVEAGTLRFDQALGQTFPEYVDRMSEQFAGITLAQLLSHSSGLPANIQLANYVGERNVVNARRRALLEALQTPLVTPPGEGYLYSNFGYILAGHMAEKVTRKRWESLVRTEVFQPLGMKSAGFGGIGSRGRVNQP